MTPTPDRPVRVAILSELPTPYRWPLFQRVGRLPGVDATVLFYSRTESDRDWALTVESEPDGVALEFLEGRAWHVRGTRSLYFHWNPGAVARVVHGKFDVVVVPGWSMPTTIWVARHCRKFGLPYVVFSETNDLAPRPAWRRALRRPLVRSIVGAASAWLATGSLSAEHLVAHGADPARTFRFANTPDSDALQAAVQDARRSRSQTRRELGIPGDATVVLFVGRLIGAKDPMTLIQAHCQLEESGASHWTVLVGDGPEADSLRTEVERRRIRHVVFTGARRPHELPEIWAASDVFALPSRHEPWGVVVNEAMTSGLPLILSDRVGAGADLLVEGRNGRSFPAGDAAALALAIAELSADPIARRRMGRESERIVADWGYEPSVEGFERAVRTAADLA